MSIQLDGHVTYPPQQQDTDARNARSTSSADTAAVAAADDGSSKQEQTHEEGKGAAAAAKADGDGAKADGDGATASSAIRWDGFWHYSTQKSRAGGPELSAFKYSFVGPVGDDPPGPPPSLAGTSGIAPTNAAADKPQPEPKTATPTPIPPLGSIGSSGGAGGDSTAAGALQQSAPAAGQIAAAGDSVALAATPAATYRNSPAEPPVTNFPSNASGQTPAEDAPLPVPTSTAAAAGGDGGGVGSKPTMLLYGPGGDGRLPSGEWAGYFIVNYGRGVEVKVEETFFLDFGPKSPRNQQTPAEPAVAVAAARAGAEPGGDTTASSLTNTAISSAATGATNDDKPHTQPPTTTDAGNQLPTPAAAARAAAGATDAVPAAIQTSTSPTVLVPIAPVVRVSGRGQNKYGEFTLTGGHERATGRLDLTRFYYEKPKEKTGTRGSGAAGSRSERSGRGVSHQKKRRQPPPGAPPPQPPGPSLAERRTKRTRCPNQRLLDDEAVSSYGTQSEPSTNSSNGGGGSGGNGSGSSNKRKSASGSSDAASTGAVGVANLSISVTGNGGGGGSGAAGADSVSSGGGSTPKPRKPRDRERDLYMEQRRREKRKAEEAAAAAKASTSASNSISSSSLRVITEISVPSESSAAELAARAKAGREVLAAIGNASDDPVEKVRRIVGCTWYPP